MVTPDRIELDVLVVGGGPAGCAAAITCARQGLKVAIMESQSFPRDRPGETLHPGVEVLWEKLGVAEDIRRASFPRVDGYYLDLADNVSFIPYAPEGKGEWWGYHAWRSELDQILASHSQAQGAEFLQNCRVRSATINAGRVSGAISDRGVVSSRYVLDSTGSARWLARNIGLRIRQLSQRLTVRYGYATGTPGDASRPIFAMRRPGWGWIAEVRSGVFAWASLTECGKFDNDFMSLLLDKMTDRGRALGADVTWKLVCECAGPGYFILGDAAASLDPACSHGVIRAISSGMLAGELVVRILQNTLSEASGAATYRDWFSAWFERDAASLLNQYRLHAPLLADRIRCPPCSPIKQ
jgi:flavin-dependent dehydrogenase